MKINNEKIIHCSDLLKIVFDFIKKMFVGLLSVCTIRSFGESLVYNSKIPIKRVSLNNHPHQARPALANINSDETFFYPFTVSVNNCGGSCNTIGDPHVRVCVPHKVRNMILKVLTLMSAVNET